MRSGARVLLSFLVLMAPVVGHGQGQYAQSGQSSAAPNMPAEAEQIFALANHARHIAGAAPLQWDPALAAAALYHCRWMVHEGQIAHRYGGEPSLTERAANAGAHFGVIEENVAIGPDAAAVHSEWMESPGHRANLLSPEVDRVGIAVIPSRGVLYAVADYSQGVPTLSASQVESSVADLIRVSGIAIASDHALARRACAMDSGFPAGAGGEQPRFIMRWQDSDLDKLPQALAQKLGSGEYRSAAIGSCPAPASGNGFSAYRVAVMLY